MQISFWWLLSFLPEGICFTVSCQSWFPFTKVFLQESFQIQWFWWSLPTSQQLSLSRETKVLFLLSLGLSRPIFLFSTLLPPLNTWPHFCWLSEEHCQIHLVLTQQGWLMVSELVVLLPFSRRLSSQVTVSETLHTDGSSTRGEGGPSLSAWIHTRAKRCGTLSYTEKFDRF